MARLAANPRTPWDVEATLRVVEDDKVERDKAEQAVADVVDAFNRIDWTIQSEHTWLRRSAEGGTLHARFTLPPGGVKTPWAECKFNPLDRKSLFYRLLAAAFRNSSWNVDYVGATADNLLVVECTAFTSSDF
jgi:hypothetical protein